MRHSLRHSLVTSLLIASVSASVAQAAHAANPVAGKHDDPSSSTGQIETALDMQRISEIIAALSENKAPPFPVLCTEMPRMFKQHLLRLGKLDSMHYLREQKGERVYELWFAGGRMIWGISAATSQEPVMVRIALLEHL